MEDQDAGVLTLDEAVQFLGTSKPTLYRLLSQGELKGLKVGRQWRFRKADLTAYMERSPIISAAPAQDLEAELAFCAERLQQVGKQMHEIRPDDEWPGNMEDAERKSLQLAYSIVKLAIATQASDIHLEPARLDAEKVSLLRLRVDGTLHETRRLAFSVHEVLVARFKVMAEMNVAERHVPQEGRIPIHHDGKDFDVRVSSVPALYGEAVTMRILDRASLGETPSLDKIHLSDVEQTQLQRWMQGPSGLVLFAGPAGSGKGTTAASCLQAAIRPGRKTVTVEDPVEYALPYATQMQINAKLGMTYADALRSLLAQDIDVVYLDTIRDLETAKAAVEAALTGHLVLATMPTPDTVSALASLVEMGLAPHLVASATVGIVAQRLVRCICLHCQEAYQVAARTLRRFGLEPDDPAGTVTLHRGKGCDHCRRRGYLGRVPLFEILEMTEEIADLVVARAPREEVSAAAQAAGMNTLTQAGLLKALDGVTTPDEVMRVTAGAV